MKKGTYVLATKYDDGDPLDNWAIGFFDRYLEKSTGRRYMVIDDKGEQFRGNGFRRAQKITAQQGRYLLDRVSEIEQSNISVWEWLERA